MRLITIEEQIAVLEKVHKANVWLATSYPDTRRLVCFKTDRAGLSVYIHGEDLQVEQYLSVDPVEYYSTVDNELREVHDALDAIIKECNEKTENEPSGAMEAS